MNGDIDDFYELTFEPCVNNTNGLLVWCPSEPNDLSTLEIWCGTPGYARAVETRQLSSREENFTCSTDHI